MTQQIDFTRVFNILDEMRHDTLDHALDEKTLRTRLKQYHSRLNREIALIIVDTSEEIAKPHHETQPPLEKLRSMEELRRVLGNDKMAIANPDDQEQVK